MATTISYPFTLDNHGKIFTTSDNSTIYLNKVRSVLSTSVLQKPMDPTYGFDMGRSLYENMGSFIPATREAIYRAIARNVPELEIKDIKFIPLSSGEDTQYQVYVLVGLPDGVSGTMAINSSIFSSNGTISGSIL